MTACRFLAALFAFFLFSPTSLRADTTIVFQEALDGRAKTAHQSIYVRDGMVRVENAFEDGNYIIYKSETNSMTVVDIKDKGYITIDRSRLEERSVLLTSAQRDAVKTAHEKIDALPPEKQGQLRSIMDYVMQYSTPAGKNVERVHFIPLQEKRLINGNTCSVTETHQGKTKVSEICMVHRTALNIPLEDYHSLQNLQSFIAEMKSRTAGDMLDYYIPHIGYAEFEQFPVQVTRYLAKGIMRTLNLVRVTADPIPLDIFSVPAEYEQMKTFF